MSPYTILPVEFPLPSFEIEPDLGYNEEATFIPFKIAVSSDSLMIVDNGFNLVECIIKGRDKQGMLVAAKTEDALLEFIFFCKEGILTGNGKQLMSELEIAFLHK